SHFHLSQFFLKEGYMELSLQHLRRSAFLGEPISLFILGSEYRYPKMFPGLITKNIRWALHYHILGAQQYFVFSLKEAINILRKGEDDVARDFDAVAALLELPIVAHTKLDL